MNASSKTLNMTGVEVHIDTSSKAKVFTFGALSLGPNEVVVLFGGGSPPGEVDSGKPNTTFGCTGKNVYVYKYQASKALNNSGSNTVTVELSGNTLASFQYGSSPCQGNQNQSVTLSPDLTGTCALHSTADATNNTLFSPGRKADGTCF